MLQANSVAIIYLAVPSSSLGRAIGVESAPRRSAWPSAPPSAGCCSPPLDGG